MRPGLRRLRVLLPVGAVLLSACGTLGAVAPSASGRIEIVMTDFAFGPSSIKVQAGQQLEIVLRNEGAHVHEFMVGREVVTNKDYLEQPVVNSFAVDFFRGLQVDVEGQGMAMNFQGSQGMEGMPGMASPSPSMEGMPGMASPSPSMGEMPGMASPSPSMGEMPGMASPSPTNPALAPIGNDMIMAEGDVGGMVMLAPGQSATLTLTVPENLAGTWQFACFAEAGLHYEYGMRGKLIVQA